jgi:hypothetical protein
MGKVAECKYFELWKSTFHSKIYHRCTSWLGMGYNMLTINADVILYRFNEFQRYIGIIVTC